jgi:LSD1 subclass zinc finger protein
MPLTLPCPSCRRTLRLPDDLGGRPVQCPACQNTFHPDAPPRPAERSRDPDAAPDDLCPECGAAVPRRADRCPGCGVELEPPGPEEEYRPWERRGAVRRDSEPHRGSLVLTLGIISLVVTVFAPCCMVSAVTGLVGVALGATAWVMGRGDLAKMEQKLVDRAGHGPTQGGYVCGIIGAILNALIVLGNVAYFAAMYFLR